MPGDVVASDPGERACPKCGAERRGDAVACAACGLTVARMAGYAAARDAAVPDVMRAAWDRANEHWDDAAVHDELLRLAVTNNCFAWAAGRYRTRTDEIAKRQLERLRRAAEVTLLATAAVRPDASTAPYRAATSVLVVLIVVIAAGLLYSMVIRGRAQPPVLPATAARPGLLGAPGRPPSPPPQQVR